MAKVGIFLITIALIAGMAGCDCYSPPCPTPPPSQNLEIRDWYDLDDVRDNLAGNHTLMNDLDSTTAGYEELASPTANQGKGWEPIGTFIPMCPYGGLIGTFDGQGYEIRDLYINRPDEYLVGLFGCVYAAGVIKDIGVVNFTVTGDSYVGGIVGRNIRGTVSNSYATGSLSGNSSVGGLVGYNQGPVTNCYAAGSVIVHAVVGSVGGVIGGFGAGGLIGLNGGPTTVSNCYFMGNVTSYSSYAAWTFLVGVGGLVGVNYGTVSDSYSNANVTGQYGVGGLVGRNLFDGTVRNSYSTGSVTGEEGVGGLVGDTVVYGTVSNCYYNHDEVLINGENVITIGALFGEDFEEWLANDKFLDVNERLSQENGYYVVNNVTDFKELLAFGQDGSLKFKLKNDLDLATEPNFYIPYFAGEFDGNGHKISNLSFNFDFVAPVGLFGVLVSGGKVSQLGAEDVNITGFAMVGGLVGISWYGTVSDSYSTGSVTSVTGNNLVGGVVGWNSGNVGYCYSTGDVSGGWGVGGVAGSNFGNVGYSYSTSSVTGDKWVGGVVGDSSSGSTVSNSYSSGSVYGSIYVGGLVGQSYDCTVSNSYFTGSVTGGDHSGGLVGRNVGWNYDSTVSNCYSTGSVTGNERVGGLVGSNWHSATVSNSYSTGSVTGSEYVGGLVAWNDGIVSNSFWDTETSGQATSDGGDGKTTEEMMNFDTFDGVGWDITAVDPGETDDAYTWNIVDDETYPFLSWESVS